MAVSAEHWLGIIHREYLARYVPGGGSAVKVVIADDTNLKRVEDGLADLAADGKLLHVRIDAAPTRIHMVQNVFFAISQHVDWGRQAQTWVERKFREHGYDWPKPGEEVPLLELAKHNNVAEALLSRALQGWLTSGIFRNHDMAQDFRNAMAHLCLARLEPPDPFSSSPVIDWLSGSLSTIGALRDVPIGAKITRNNGRAMLRSLCHWLRLTGVPGLVVTLDLRHLSSPVASPAGENRYTPSAVLDAFEVLRQFIDDCDLFEGLLLVALGGDALVAGEPRRTISAYSALRQRLETDVRSVSHDNPLAPLVRVGTSRTVAPTNAGDSPYSGERVAIEALRAGVPNRVATRLLGSDEHAIETDFVSQLKQVREADENTPTPPGLLIGGEFGSGKSHLLGYLAEHALHQDFVVSVVTISKETPLFNRERVFAAAVRNAIVPDINDDLMRVVVERLLTRSEQLQQLEEWVSRPDSGFSPIFAALLHILPKHIINAEDRSAVARFFGGSRLGIPRLRGWLRVAGSLKLFELSAVRASELAEQRLRLAPLLFRAAGFSGWCVLFDELELMARYSTLQRGKSYAELARWLGLDPATSISGTVAIGAITSDFRKAVLQDRLDEEKIVPLLEARDLNVAAVLAERAMKLIDRNLRQLKQPDEERLARSQRDTRRLYSVSYGWEPMQSGIGEWRAAKPIREFIKSWVTGWDIERFYGTQDAIEVVPILPDYEENPDMEKISASEEDLD